MHIKVVLYTVRERRLLQGPDGAPKQLLYVCWAIPTPNLSCRLGTSFLGAAGAAAGRLWRMLFSKSTFMKLGAQSEKHIIYIIKAKHLDSHIQSFAKDVCFCFQHLSHATSSCWVWTLTTGDKLCPTSRGNVGSFMRSCRPTLFSLKYENSTSKGRCVYFRTTKRNFIFIILSCILLNDFQTPTRRKWTLPTTVWCCQATILKPGGLHHGKVKDLTLCDQAILEEKLSVPLGSRRYVLFCFFYALKPKLLRFTDTLVWALWHCVWEGATVQPMDSLDQSTLPLPEVIWGNIPCDLHPRHPKHPKAPNRCNMKKIEKATKRPWWTGIGKCIQITTC